MTDLRRKLIQTVSDIVRSQTCGFGDRPRGDRVLFLRSIAELLQTLSSSRSPRIALKLLPKGTDLTVGPVWFSDDSEGCLPPMPRFSRDCQYDDGVEVDLGHVATAMTRTMPAIVDDPVFLTDLVSILQEFAKPDPPASGGSSTPTSGGSA